MEMEFTHGKILPTIMENELQTSFIDYAMSVITSRALPDVRDGLKPVHRRILFSLYKNGMTPDKKHKKSAHIVGDVLAKYHPHGDSSVYDAMVRLAQDFNIRYPLVDGQGNFGSVDGDSAAAMRYTEAKMTKLTLEMLADLEKETVDFGLNYDESLEEPLVLPSRFPNLLVNGSSGIAVGMATNIPPHNLVEVINAVQAIAKDPNITPSEIMDNYLFGPDFPTGGTVEGKDEIRKAMVEAMKAKDKETKDALSLLLAALKNKAIDKRADLTEEEEIQVILKEIKQTIRRLALLGSIQMP